MKKIAAIFFKDNFKSRVIILYCVMLAVLSWTTFSLEGDSVKSSMTVLNILLFIVPLMSLLYATTYIYNSHEFLILLLCQPLKRSQIWNSLYVGIIGSLVSAFVIGAGVPILIYNPNLSGLLMVLCGIVITLIFSSVAFLTTVMTSDKTAGVGIAILIWLLFTIVYDGLCLLLLFSLSDYPIENIMMGILMLNPLDITRFIAILSFDNEAMMGFSGAAFKAFFGTTSGVIIATALNAAWIILPYYFSRKLFKVKDL